MKHSIEMFDTGRYYSSYYGNYRRWHFTPIEVVE